MQFSLNMSVTDGHFSLKFGIKILPDNTQVKFVDLSSQNYESWA